MATASVLGDGDLTSSTVMETVTGTVGSSAHAVQMSLYHHAQSTIFVLWAWCRSVALSSALACGRSQWSARTARQRDCISWSSDASMGKERAASLGAVWCGGSLRLNGWMSWDRRQRQQD